MGAAVPIISAIGAIGTLLSGIAALTTSFKAPKIQIPKIEIPKELFQRLDLAVQKASGLSETARQTVQEAIERYKRGELLPHYEAQLQAWWRDNYRRLIEEASARGIERSSIFQSMLQDLTSKYKMLYGDLLQRQLQEALSLSGLTTTDIEAIMKEADIWRQTLMSQAQLQLQGIELSSMLAGARGQALASAGQSFARLSEFARQFSEK
ncbi:MAG: hypothetical protein QW272_09545 [Candidatus Methanomethylicaceae archaeon]